MRSIQVDAAAHYGPSYLGLVRLVTLWHQAQEVARAAPAGGRVLEIGPGAGYTTFLLRTWGYRVTTMDFDPEVGADVTADVTRISFADESFDCVIAAQVLEHIPFEEFASAVREIARVSSGHVIITLPAPLVGLGMLFNRPGVAPRGFSLGLPYWVKHRFDGQHYWELGKRDFGFRRVRREISGQDLEIVREFRPGLSLRCYFFVARKRQKRSLHAPC
jgi:SAM-dependent methyltransferase